VPFEGRLVVMTANSSVLGNVRNTGFISAGEYRPLNIYGISSFFLFSFAFLFILFLGNYIQDKNATLLLELDNQGVPIVSIVGATNVSLAGTFLLFFSFLFFFLFFPEF